MSKKLNVIIIMEKKTISLNKSKIEEEASRRRTFAIISHPDAGKTTLTEKFLLYGGALKLAGAVSAKKKQSETASDWMELEKKRGISVSSTVLQFEYKGYRLNLLDTPGHRDFSEDTYRVLMAVDAAIMVIDAGKGIETQTRKLFKICAKRGIPIFTFINKLDLHSLESLELIDQLEKVLDLQSFPLNWPIGNGRDFKGVFDRINRKIHLFKKTPGGKYKAPVSMHNLSDTISENLVSPDLYKKIKEEIELIDITCGSFNRKSVAKGKLTPVFFGSALNNFGVEYMLKNFLKYSSPPKPRSGKNGSVKISSPHFSAFVFKVQTNMNPKHRDRMVFMRVCSGKFNREMKIRHQRLNKEFRLSSSHNVFGRNRETLTTAYPGDIVGFISRDDFKVGDTLSTSKNIVYNEIPRFAPEIFAFIRNPSPANYKSFRKGIRHFLAEDLVQAFRLPAHPNPTPLLGAVGPLQFDVLQYRLKKEYNADSELDMMPWKSLRWIQTELESSDLKKSLPYGAALGKDLLQRPVILFNETWSAEHYASKNPDVKIYETPPAEGL
ncbi:MAG: peptide chain release factor 3 [Elusimicrobiota bacterium]